MQDRILEPVGEVGRAAALAAALVRLAMAVGRAGWASHADVEVVVMAEPGPDFSQPAPVARGLAAQRLLDRGIDEDALHGRLPRGIPDDHPVLRCPGLRVDI